MADTERIVLKRETIKLGFGSTARTTTVENYYQVDEAKDPSKVNLRLLDINDQPLAVGEIIDREELEKEYIPCPDFRQKKNDPQQAQAERHIENGERHLEKKEYFTAEREFDRALFFNQDNLRANLGKGKSLFARGDKEEGRKIFEHLSRMDHLYEEDNKHIFNEFGIELRKRKLFEEAIANYSKALAIDPNDAVLYYNLSRAHFEKGDGDQAREYLHQALELKSDFPEARDFMAVLEKAGSSVGAMNSRSG